MKSVAAILLLLALPFAHAKEPPAVKRTAPGKYRIQKSYLDGLEKDVAKVLQQARAVPHLEEGNVVGFKLSDIAPGSIYDKLELKNGDVILSINGTELKSSLSALTAVASLKGKSRMDLKLRRSGKVMSRTYDVAK